MAKKRLCSVDGCGKPHDGHGFCSTHKYRFKRYGSPFGKHNPNRSHHDEHVSFLDQLLKASTSGDDCVSWPFGRMKFGYGQTTIDGRKWLVHTYVCIQTHGPSPTSKHQASHACGNGHLGCVNPRHIRWLTPSENQREREKHGTAMKGVNSPMAKLTEEDVLQIRRLKGLVTQDDIASMFGITQSQVSHIIHRKAWSHLPA